MSNLEFYRENGYLITEAVFSRERCDAAVKIYEKYAKGDFRGVMNIERGEVEYQEAPEKIERVRVEDNDAETIWDMIREPRVVAILEELQAAEVVNLQSMFLFKKAKSPYASQAWNPHQDGAYVMARPGWYITGNFAFTDQSPENGGMFIYPGSHREPLLPNEKVKSFHENSGESPGHCVAVPQKYQKTDLHIQKGSVLFLHGHVIHGSYPNRSKDQSRPMLLVPYGTRGITHDPNFISGKTGRRQEHSLRETWQSLFGKGLPRRPQGVRQEA